MVRPVPIPNTAVKHSLADGSGCIASARVGCRQSFKQMPENCFLRLLFYEDIFPCPCNVIKTLTIALSFEVYEGTCIIQTAHHVNYSVKRSVASNGCTSANSLPEFHRPIPHTLTAGLTILSKLDVASLNAEFARSNPLRIFSKCSVNFTTREKFPARLPRFFARSPFANVAANSRSPNAAARSTMPASPAKFFFPPPK